jgi:hypothetical protein
LIKGGKVVRGEGARLGALGWAGAIGYACGFFSPVALLDKPFEHPVTQGLQLFIP